MEGCLGFFFRNVHFTAREELWITVIQKNICTGQVWDNFLKTIITSSITTNEVWNFQNDSGLYKHILDTRHFLKGPVLQVVVNKKIGNTRYSPPPCPTFSHPLTKVLIFPIRSCSWRIEWGLASVRFPLPWGRLD